MVARNEPILAGVTHRWRRRLQRCELLRPTRPPCATWVEGKRPRKWHRVRQTAKLGPAARLVSGSGTSTEA
jgi:hypothetical protein